MERNILLEATVAELSASDIWVEYSTVTVNGIRVDADIGIRAEEVGRKQPLVISVTITLFGNGSMAEIETVDYAAIVSAARQLAEERIGLIEGYARRLAHLVMEYPATIAAEITVIKPMALQNGQASTKLKVVRPNHRAAQAEPRPEACREAHKCRLSIDENVD